MQPDHEADRPFDDWIGSDQAKLGSYRDVFRAGWEAQADVCRHIDDVETAEAVAQMVAGDRDEALENVARVEQAYGALKDAAVAVMLWAIDLVPQSPPAPKVWRCRGCGQRGEYAAVIEHGPTCPFGKLDATIPDGWEPKLEGA